MKHAAEKLLAPRPVVRVLSDNASGYAVSVIENDTSYLVMDSSLMDGAASLSITLLATNNSVRYLSFQFAQNKPLVRFVTDNTNIVSLALADESVVALETDMVWLTPNVPNDCVYSGKVDISDSFELSDEVADINLVAMIDGQTNLVGIVCDYDGKKVLTPITDEIEWVNVMPLEYRNQTKLLVEATQQTKTGTISPDIVAKLETTEWVIELLKKRAKRLLVGDY